mmetsp:Transcript_26964/g.81631  ORF Transcript_26964/g.81631 Transcript_26964/m.81631 type:complete len:208 (+) Transcript_26964:233-856(+)
MGRRAAERRRTVGRIGSPAAVIDASPSHACTLLSRSLRVASTERRRRSFAVSVSRRGSHHRSGRRRPPDRRLRRSPVQPPRPPRSPLHRSTCGRTPYPRRCCSSFARPSHRVHHTGARQGMARRPRTSATSPSSSPISPGSSRAHASQLTQLRRSSVRWHPCVRVKTWWKRSGGCTRGPRAAVRGISCTMTCKRGCSKRKGGSSTRR